MRLGIVGGALQGIEAVYLSRKAGFETVVLDRREDAPARSISDSSVTVDVVKEPDKALKTLSDCDAVIPAVENLDVLQTLESMKDRFGGPFLFDLAAYDISCSKERSNEIMSQIGVPMPGKYPECGFPIIVKPSCQSGSVGVSEVNGPEEMDAALKKVADLNDTPIIQEFVHGKSISVECIGNGKTARPYVTTQVVLDSKYDCKQVICRPDILSKEDNEHFGECIKLVAEDIHLNGLMDMEAILSPKGFRVLEIDARIPSQTPAAICAATGVNLLDELYLAGSGKRSAAVRKNGYSSYEHFRIDGVTAYACGEKVFSHVRAPRIEYGLFGADEAITDYEPGKGEWYITMINRGDTWEELFWKRKDAINSMMRDCELEDFRDSAPEVV